LAIRTAEGAPRRSKAWIYYAVIAVLAGIGGFAHPIGFIGLLLAGVYAYYLFQGGTVVIWFW
jgi:hypothetical protein